MSNARESTEARMFIPTPVSRGDTGAGSRNGARADRARQRRVLALSAPAVADAIPNLRHEITAFAVRNGADAGVAHDVALAVTEAATNVVKHAYGYAPRGGVDVAVIVEDDWLELAVADHGTGFRADSTDELGLGLEIIARVSADMTITQSPDGSEVRMRFPLPRGPR
jgi:anti-sigma regulatory factor (Ser/Thr protein kinase)